MSKRLFKTMVAVLAIAAAAAGPVRGQTTYNVTFGGFSNPYMNTTVNVASLPQTFTEIGGYNFYPWQVIGGDADEFTSVSVTSDGNGKVSANMVNWSQMTITVTGTFEGTATIHVTGIGESPDPIGRDITVSCVAAPVPHTVRMAAGTEDAANWSLASGNASVPGNQVLENVMSGSQVTATYNGTTKKVKSVKAVKYVAPEATVTTAPTATGAIIEVGSTAALVNAGAANGGSMMYAVTTTNAQPASTADFSATIPTAEGRTAGTYYVWYYAKADADHSDSEIAGPVSVTVAEVITVTINQSDWGWDLQFTKDGVTVSVGSIDPMSGNLMSGGTFSTTLGNFTQIVVTTASCEASGTGWSDSYSSSQTWAGTPASTVSFSGNFMGRSQTQTTIVCTIALTN